MDKKQYQQTVSVIVPVYNGETYLKQCLTSICKQSFRDLEIIVVDDGSTDGSAQIVQKIAAEDPRVRLCQHEQNMGLFQARITGVEASHGEYIGFVDGDDEVSIDWFRLLYQTAKEQGNDITVGQLFNKYSDGRLEYMNLDPLRQEICFEGDEVFQRYIEQEGLCYSWQLVWNKLYTRELWFRTLEDVKAFSEKHPRFVMCEDMAFSTALWLRAKRVGNFTEGAVIYYFHHVGQSTAVSPERSVTVKKIHDIISAFDFMEEQIKKFDRYDKNSRHFQNWKLYYARMYYGMLRKTKNKSKDKNEDLALLCELFSISDSKIILKDESAQHYFYTVNSPVNKPLLDQMEDTKKQICSDHIRVVSFDIFDTLILRPFFAPTDLFLLMNDLFCQLTDINSYVNFADMRVSAEARCRARIAEQNACFEEITLDEIYEQLALDYGINEKILDTLKEKEKELELRFCVVRKMGKQLLELARSQGKQVILCSDMYLPKDTVEKILKKNGIEYDRLYLSSELRVTKGSKNLFRYVQKQLQVPSNAFIHIGDNPESDVQAPKELGWNSVHFIKTVDLFRGSNVVLGGGNAYTRMFERNGLIRDGMSAEWSFLGYRCAMALVANRFYDNPFATVAADTDLDADSYRIGYFSVGHYLYAVTEWIIKEAKRQGCEKLHFVARDGYLPMEAYRIMRSYRKDLPEDHYLYISRKALELVDIYHCMDLYSFCHKAPIENYSIQRLDTLLREYYKDGVTSLQEIMGIGEAVYKKKFDNRKQYDTAIAYLKQCVDFEKLKAKQQVLREYFEKMIGKNDLMFDIGYSGRGEAALSRLLGYPVSSLYVHCNTQSVMDRERTHGFHTDCFYDYKPAITGVIREHVFMKLAPSTIGYEYVNGEMVPEFEKNYKCNAATEIVTRTVQGAALDFVRDMCSVFEGYTDLLAYRKDDLAFSFEYYLHYSKPTDRKVFGCVVFEDELGYAKALSALDFWNNDIEMFRLNRLFASADNGSSVSIDNFRGTLMPYSFRATCRQIFKLTKNWMRAKFFLNKHVKLLEQSSLFDAKWYLKTYADVRSAGLDPIRHYLLYGWKEMRDPSADFSTRSYLQHNPDVLAQGICPLLHYEQNGKNEQRKF